ncbi:uncharacterized protein Ecym_6120 [Eremothecium cymbalariae DBVPG|uniref:Uncharacterized protein n=1 Tax=Eremothecium cymbalariae (strain CBS 270.75 / DBVPG 7215 / KCTC 17166 / NRRL Y-17582) TaxID=931890 RepID=G8JV34_ERECY|nr:hypothetical protein Ecym_6120 [Eremothecium cymbalariae DBVPG\
MFSLDPQPSVCVLAAALPGPPLPVPLLLATWLQAGSCIMYVALRARLHRRWCATQQQLLSASRRKTYTLFRPQNEPKKARSLLHWVPGSNPFAMGFALPIEHY